MRKFLFSILLLFILSYIGPGLCSTADDDRYKRPDIDIVDFDEPDTQNDDALVPEPSDDKVEEDTTSPDEEKPTPQAQDTPKEITTPETSEKKKDKGKEPAPEVQQNTEIPQVKNTRETPKPDQVTPPTDINENLAAKPIETPTQPLETDTDKSNKPEPEKNDKPVDSAPRQPTENVKPNPTAQPNPTTPPPQGQPQGQRGPNPVPNQQQQQQQGRPGQNPQKPPQGAPQQGQPGPQGAQPHPNAAQNANQGRPGPAPQGQPTPQQPEQVKQQVQKEIVKEEVVPPVQQKVATPEPTKAEKNKQAEASKPKKNHPEPEDLLMEEEYRRLLGENDGIDAYLEQYRGYSELFYKNAEHLTQEVLVPFYKQIRANDYLSLGLSSFLVLYFVISVFRAIGSLFKKKPKFRYNKEETVSYSDINNNFKKFISELDALKKQNEANAKKGTANASQVSQAGETTTVSAAIPQELQNEISYIAQNLSRNDELLNKITKDKRQLDSFLVEFQKEVVESHKAIWNELYQLRKLFSMGKLNVSTSSLKSKADTKESDETKSLSSNPEINETKKRDEARLTQKVVSEPRSKSVATSGEGPLRSRKLAPPTEKRPQQQEVAPKRPSIHQNGDTTEPSAPEVPQTREEEPQKEAHVIAPPPERTPFRKLSRDHDVQPTIQIPTTENANLNPFAANPGAVSITANPTNAKTAPFGAARKLSNKIPGGRPSSIQDIDQAINTLPKTDADNGLRNSASGLGLQASQQNSNVNNPEAPNAEEKPEVRDPEQNLEEAKPVEQGDEAQSGANEETEASSELSGPSKAFVPPRAGPMIGMNAGVRKIGVPGVPTNKNLPVPGPGIKRPGPPGAAVFRGPPGNLPRPGGPTPIKQPVGQIQDGAPQQNSQV